MSVAGDRTVSEPMILIAETEEARSPVQAVLRGLRGRCPACGEGRVLQGYLTATPACRSCGESYSDLRADDMPPWLTILVVGHIVVPLMVLVEELYRPEVWVHLSLWLPLTLGLSLVLLPPNTRMSFQTVSCGTDGLVTSCLNTVDNSGFVLSPAGSFTF